MSQAPSIYMCRQCGFLYEVSEGAPEFGIPAKTAVEEFPELWQCPECHANIACLEEIL